MTRENEIERLLALPADQARREATPLITEFRAGLNRGEFRAAQKDASVWRTNVWVKRGILLAFRIGQVVDRSVPGEFFFSIKIPCLHIPSDRPTEFASSPAVRRFGMVHSSAAM